MQTHIDLGIKDITANTPLRYTGGKTQARQDLYRFFRDLGAKRVVSPFCGGCSFELYTASKGIEVVACDNLGELIDFWQVLRDTSDELVNKIEECLDSIGFIITKDIDTIAEMLPKCEEHLRNAAQYCLDSDDRIEQSAWFYIRNRTAYQAMMFHAKRCLQMIELKLGTKFSYKRLEQLKKFRTTANFEHLDYSQCIEKYSGSYFYLDPPYFDVKIATKYGKENDIPFNHDVLRESIGAEDNGILSYNDIHQIRELYSDYMFVEAKWHHASRKTQNSRGNEIFIMPHHIYQSLLK